MLTRIKPLPRSKFFPAFDLDKEECVVCGKRAGEHWAELEEDPQEVVITVDLHLLPWCQFCDHRRRALDWGERNNFPAIDLGSYRLSCGMGYWHPFLLSRNIILALDVCMERYKPAEDNNDLIWALIAYIECLENDNEGA